MQHNSSSPRGSLKSTCSILSHSEVKRSRSSLNSSTKSVTFQDIVEQSRASNKDIEQVKQSPEWSIGGQKVVLSTLSSPSAHSGRAAYVLTRSSISGCDMQGAESLVKWSRTGSLPLIVPSGTSFRRFSERVHVILPLDEARFTPPKSNTPLKPARSDSNGSNSGPAPSTANQSAQTRSVRFDRRRPQTLELRRGSSRSFIAGCAEADSYLMEEQKHLKRASVVIGVIATVIFLLCVAMVAVTLHFTPVMNRFANQRQTNASLVAHLPSNPSSSVFDHPIVGFDRVKIIKNADSSTSNDNNQLTNAETNLKDDTNKKTTTTNSSKAPHAQQ